MARIRTTKPEFYTSEQVMGLSISARYAFQGLWVFCDDGGNHPASAKTLKAEIFPSDEITAAQVQCLVGEMIAQGLVVVYEAAGKEYWHVTGWHHQRIEKPTFKYPKFDESSKKAPGTVDEESPNPPRVLDPVLEGIGNGEERKEKGEDPVPDGTAGASDVQVAQLTEAQIWKAGIELLSKSGMAEAQARTFLGGLVKNHGKQATQEAVSAAVAEQPVDPRAYLRAVCSRSGAPGRMSFAGADEQRARDQANAWMGKGRAKPIRHGDFTEIDYREGVASDARLI